MTKLIISALAVLAAAAAAMPYYHLPHLAGYAPGAHGPERNVAYHPLQRFGLDLPSIPPVSLPSVPSFPSSSAPKALDVSAPSSSGASISLPSWYVVLHSWTWTRYITWSYSAHPLTTGLTWGIQCKDLGCQTKTGFVGFRDAKNRGFLRKTGVEAVGSTEHSHDYGKVFCPAGKFMTSMNCKDLACTSMELVCAPLKLGFRAVYGERWGGVWDSDYQRVYCKEGEYIDGIECIGSCTEKFNIFCSKVEALSKHS